MFKFADMNIVVWPVEFRQPGLDGGDTATVHVHFKLLPREVLNARDLAVAKRLAARVDTDASSIGQLMEMAEAVIERRPEDEQLIVDHITGWNADDFEGRVEFSVENLRALLQYDVYYTPLMAGLHEASRHGPLKNSLPGPGGMPARVQG